MNFDIGPILDNWRYIPNDINVRLVDGLDGTQKIQMRLDLGLLQMEMDGRPDGLRPKEFDSYLSYYQHKANDALEDLRMDDTQFELTPLDCLKLQQESIQYYHRYLALMKLADYPRVARDTSRNIQVFDFVKEYATEEELIWSFEQYRPYVIMMNTRALASMSMESEGIEEALRFIQVGVEKINLFYQEHKEKLPNHSFERDFLEQWAKELEEKRPLSQQEELEKELERAIIQENYERAAEIRDRLKYL
jgi:hypothetical protein